MKIKQLFKKAFTMVELVIVIAVVAVLAATSVGIYFGVMNSKPDEQSISIQEQVITLWEGYISDSTKYYDDIENKAFEFCTEYASKKGINVELNYRVLEFDDFVSSIVEANGIQRAYDPSGNAKEAVIIKIDTTYPSFFISTAYSVLKVNLPQPTEELLIKEIVKDPFVIESGLLSRYRIDENSKPESFNSFYELSDINVNGEIKRGIRYVRYLVNHADNNSEEVYKPEYIVYGRANRTLNEECEGRYLPDYFQETIGDMTINTTTYDLIEKRNDVSFLYDPDHYYTYFSESFTHDESLTNVEVYDKETEEFVTKECPLSKFDAQYVVGEQKISYDPYIDLGGSGGGAAGNPDQEIDINTPLEDLPERPDEDDFSTEEIVKIYPIILYFSETINVTIEDMPTMSKLLNALGFRDKKFQFLYFNNFESLSILIESPNFYELTQGLTDKNVYIYVCDGAVLEGALTLRDIDANSGFHFVVYHRPEIEIKNGVAKDIRLDNLYDITGRREGFKREDPDLTLDVMYMNQKRYSSTSGTPYKVTWPEKPTKTFTIAKTGVLTVGTNSKLFIESNCYPTSNDGWKLPGSTQSARPHGYTISEYAEVINEGTIRLTSNAQARITGIIRRNTPITDPKADRFGMIIAEQQSIVSEPFRITDYIGHKNTNNAFIDRNIFPSEFYYLDSIRCRLTIKDSARYVGLITINDYRNDADTLLTYLGNIDLVSSQKYVRDTSKNEYGSIFKLSGSNSSFMKSYDEVTNRSNFEVVSGNLNYNFAYVDILKWYGPSMNGYDSEGSPAFKKFTTEDTGFKLSNINLIVREGATFTMPSTSYNGGNTRYPELEVLPTSSIQIIEGASMNMGQNTYIHINNFYADESICNEIINKINETTEFYTLGKRDDILQDRLYDNQVKMYEVYHSSNLPMLIVNGTVNIDATVTNHIESVDEKYRDCEEKHYHVVKYDCVNQVVTERTLKTQTINSAIYSWVQQRFEGKAASLSLNKKTIYTTNKHTYHHICGCFWDHDCGKVSYSYQVNENLYTFNDVAFAWGGGQSCYTFPSFITKF